MGNTLIVVEHDEDTMYVADHIVDIGPEQGIHGGEIVAEGTIEEIKTILIPLLGCNIYRERKKLKYQKTEEKPNGNWIEIKGAKENNLKISMQNSHRFIYLCQNRSIWFR